MSVCKEAIREDFPELCALAEFCEKFLKGFFEGIATVLVVVFSFVAECIIFVVQVFINNPTLALTFVIGIYYILTRPKQEPPQTKVKDQ